MIGKMISHYKILDKLGGGGMGVVYKAEDTKLKRHVALKFLSAHLTQDAEAKKRFIKEAQAASALQHPNICTIHEINETDDDQIYIAMEYLDGKTLKDKIKDKVLSIEETLDLISQIARGLDKAHGKGIVHRDIKPANLMITEDGLCKIVDFGLAKLAGQTKMTKTGSTLGTAAYMSPEQARGEEVDHRTDIWSLGIILYEMLAGEHPFKGEYEQAVVYSILNEDPKHVTDLRQDIPVSIEQVVSRALEKKPDERYQQVDDLLDDFKSISAGILPNEIKVRLRKEKLRKRKKTGIYVGAACLIIVMTVTALWKLLPQKAVVAPIIENSIAVISFENLTGDESQNILQRIIPNLLITNLENAGFFHVATWDRLRDLMKQIGKENEETIDKKNGFKLCLREGIEAVVLGSVMKVGDVFATEVKVFDVESRKLIKSSRSQGEGMNSIIKTQIDELSREIALGVGITREEIASAKLNISEFTTSSMEAYNYFLQGRKDWYNQYSKEAIIRLEKAVELDPDFAMAYLYLGFTYYLVRDYKIGRECFEKAKALSDKVSEKERLYIEAEYASYIERFSEKKLENYKKIVEKYPREKQAHLELSKIYRKRDMYSEVIKHAEIVLALDPSWGDAYEEMAFAYANTGDNEKALEYLEKGLAAIPGDPNMNLTTGHFYVKFGMIDEAIRKFKDALDIKPDFNIENYIAYAYAMKEDYPETFQWIDKFIENAHTEGRKADPGFISMGFYHYFLGNSKLAIEYLQRAYGNPWGGFNINPRAEYIMAYVNFGRGEFELCRDQFQRWYDRAMERYPQEAQDSRNYASFWLYQPLGAIELKRGNIDAARSNLTKLEALMPKITSPQKLEGYYWLLAQILLAEESYDQAISVLEDCPRMKMPWLWLSQAVITYNLFNINSFLAQAYKEKGDLDKAIEVYERLTDPKPENREGRLIYPKNYYYLAECYEIKGLKVKAIKLYKKFLTLWKDADIGTAEIEAAQKRLVNLKTKG